MSDLRNYNEGDDIRSINWKLSSKMDELIVRQPSDPTRYNVALMPDIGFRGDSRNISHSDLNTAVALGAALCEQFIKNSTAFCLMIPDLVPGWMLIIILAREFTIAGMRTVAASEGIVIAAGMSGKIKTVLQMIAVPMLLLVPLLTNIYQEHMGAGFLSQELYHAYVIAANGFLWASLVMTVYSGVEYVWKNKSVFSM